jgi:hypothetical protein
MSVRPDRIPTFVVASTREELRSFFQPLNILTGEFLDFKVMRNEKENIYEAWFYTMAENIIPIERMIDEMKKRGK